MSLTHRLYVLAPIAMLLAWGCTAREVALVSLAEDCETAAALLESEETVFCSFVEVCMIERSACCGEELRCEDGVLVGGPVVCGSGCVECRVDSDCHVAQFCEGSLCIETP